MDASNQTINNAPLLAAIARMQTEGSRESREAVLDLVISSAQFLAPVTIIEHAKDTYGEDTAIQFQLLQNQSGQPFFPAFTGWEELMGCGSQTGEPHLGTHAWPTMNSALISVMEDEKAVEFLSRLRKLDEENPLQGIRAFTWKVEEMI